uniref:Pol protein n=1 Tax=Phytophthora ramorum TaxID=164328 RepID=H3GDT1_PHYRM
MCHTESMELPTPPLSHHRMWVTKDHAVVGIDDVIAAPGVATSDSERENSPQARPAEGCYHFFDGGTGCTVNAGSTTLAALPEVSELLNLEEMSMDDFLAQLKAEAIAEMVLLKPEASPEELSSSSVMDKDVLDELGKKRATRTGSAILENPKDPVYPLVKEFSDVARD